MKKLFLNLVKLLFILSFSESRDLYVSKGHNYETDSYLLFDEFNDTLDTPGRYANAKHAQYYPACDAVDLGENGPILGTNFTQEAWISRARDNFLNGKKLQLIMGYNHVDAIGSDGDSPARAAALPAGGGQLFLILIVHLIVKKRPTLSFTGVKGLCMDLGQEIPESS